MSDFSARRYGDQTTAALQADIERTVTTLRADMKASELPYTPGADSSWSAPAPTTIGEALDRLSKHFTTVGHGGAP
ncbi:MAG: hypothetical protein RLP09_09590 [Sandaracinaceae bacterium]